VPDLTGIDPDDAFSRIPYEKGSTFLWYLEDLVGGAEQFEPFLKCYIKEFEYKSIDTNTFKDFFLTYFAGVDSVSSIDWDTWLYKPGMPPYKPSFDPSLAIICNTLAKRWLDWNCSSEPCPLNGSELKNLSPSQVQEVLATLLKGQFSSEKVAKMNQVYNLGSSSNYEILFLWLRLGILTRWEPVVEASFNFLSSMGRLKFVQPIYRDLGAWPEKREMTLQFFKRNRNKLMSSCAEAVGKDLGVMC